MARKGSGTGQGGKTLQDRKLAARLRKKLLEAIEVSISDKPEDIKQVRKWGEFKRQMLLKLATNALPRLNEHTGKDGGDIKHKQTVTIVKYAKRNTATA